MIMITNMITMMITVHCNDDYSDDYNDNGDYHDDRSGQLSAWKLDVAGVAIVQLDLLDLVRAIVHLDLIAIGQLLTHGSLSTICVSCCCGKGSHRSSN